MRPGHLYPASTLPLEGSAPTYVPRPKSCFGPASQRASNWPLLESSRSATAQCKDFEAAQPVLIFKWPDQIGSDRFRMESKSKFCLPYFEFFNHCKPYDRSMYLQSSILFFMKADLKWALSDIRYIFNDCI